MKWLAFLELKIDDFRDRRGLALALYWHLSHRQRSEIVWLKQAFKNPHFMATVLVMVDLLGLIAKYRDIATGSW